MLAEGRLPAKYTVKKRKLIKIKKTAGKKHLKPPRPQAA